jgi:hypothetical protein
MRSGIDNHGALMICLHAGGNLASVKTGFGLLGADGGADSFVRMKEDLAIFFAPDEAHGKAPPQFAARRLVANTAQQAGAQYMQFGPQPRAIKIANLEFLKLHQFMAPCEAGDGGFFGEQGQIRSGRSAAV